MTAPVILLRPDGVGEMVTPGQRDRASFANPALRSPDPAVRHPAMWDLLDARFRRIFGAQPPTLTRLAEVGAYVPGAAVRVRVDGGRR